MIRSHMLHLFAYTALHTVGRLPHGLERSIRWTRRVGSRWARVDQSDAGDLARSLRFGTCLSRAMVVAAQVPNTVIVIGVEPGWRKTPEAPHLAHAWVEVDGRPTPADTPRGAEIARFA